MTSANPRDEQIAAFFARQADRLQRVVTAHVNAPTQTIEDACQNAWMSLLRRDDVALDERGAKWLTTVAVSDGWRLARRARDVPRDVAPPGTPDENEASEPASLASGTDEQAIARTEHAQRVADLQTLKSRERRDLFLLALGYRYHEIAALSGVRAVVDECLARLMRWRHVIDVGARLGDAWL